MHLIKQKYKKDRALGVNLWGSSKSPLNKRQSRPGQHGTRRRRKLSNFALQLNAKQKFRFYYGMKEGQFRNLVSGVMRSRQKGDIGTSIVRKLESRLDSCVYRLNWASSIFAAKQLVSHKHILVNGSKVNISSYLLSPGDKISLSEKAKNMGIVRSAIENASSEIPVYLEASSDGLSGTFKKLPDSIEEVAYPAQMDISPVIGMYSRLV